MKAQKKGENYKIHLEKGEVDGKGRIFNLRNGERRVLETELLDSENNATGWTLAFEWEINEDTVTGSNLIEYESKKIVRVIGGRFLYESLLENGKCIEPIPFNPHGIMEIEYARNYIRTKA